MMAYSVSHWANLVVNDMASSLRMLSSVPPWSPPRTEGAFLFSCPAASASFPRHIRRLASAKWIFIPKKSSWPKKTSSSLLMLVSQVERGGGGRETSVLSHFHRFWFYDPRDCNPPGSCVHGILPAGIPGRYSWVAMPSSRGFPPRGPTLDSSVSCIGSRALGSLPKVCSWERACYQGGRCGEPLREAGKQRLWWAGEGETGASLLHRTGWRDCAQASESMGRSHVWARFLATRALCLPAQSLQSKGEAMSPLALWAVFLPEKVIA